MNMYISHTVCSKHIRTEYLDKQYRLGSDAAQPYNFPLRKHTYSNIYKILSPKTENFQIKNSDIFHISAQNIDCGYSLEPPRRGGSNEYPQSVF